MHSPSLEQFKQLASQGNLIPVVRRLLADVETPLSAYRKIRGQGESFVLESVEGGEHLGSYSFVGCTPRAVIKQTGRIVEAFSVATKSLTPSLSPSDGERVAQPGEWTIVRDGLEVVERVMKRFRP